MFKMKRFFRFSMFGLSLLVVSVFGCKHDGGKNSPSSEDPTPVLQNMTVHGKTVVNGKVTVPNDKEAVKTGDITANFNIADVKVKVKDEPVSLEEGKETDVTIVVPAVEGKYKAIVDIVIKVTREKKPEDPTPVLQSMTVHGEPVVNGKVTVPNDKEAVKTGDITANFNIADVKVKVKDEPVSLEEGKETDVTIVVPAVEGKYKAIADIVIKVTREKKPEDPEPALQSMTVHGEPVVNGKVTIPNEKDSVKSGDIDAVFDYGEGNKTITVTVANGDALEEGKERDVNLTVPALSGKYKVWNGVVKVTRKKPTIVKNIIVNGFYVDDKILIDPTKEYAINKDSCVVKIMVPKQYAKVEIDGGIASYVAGATSSAPGAYSKEITGIAKGTTKSVIVTVTDQDYDNSPFSKTLKIKHEDSSSYTPSEITRIDIGDQSYKPADVEGKTFSLNNGTALSLSVFFKNNVPADKETVKFIVGDGVGDKTVEIKVKGKRVNHSFNSITQGEHDVKIQRLVNTEVKDTFSFKVKYEVPLQKIRVAKLVIEDEKAKNVVTFKKTPSGGSRALSELELADEANLYQYEYSEGDKINLLVDVITEDVTLEYKLNSNAWVSMVSNSKVEIQLPEGINNIQLQFKKDGFKDLLYKFKAVKKAIRVGTITVGTNSYTWEQFSALTTPIDVSEDKVTITASWENNETLTPTLKRNGKEVTLSYNKDKTAKWIDVSLEPGETNFRLTLKIDGFPEWKNKEFRVKKPITQESNTNISDLKIFGFRRADMISQAVEWPFAKDGMTEFTLYIKPESNEVKGIKMKFPSEATLNKTNEAGYEGYYRANLTIAAGEKIVFEVEAKDGSKKEYYVDKEGKLKTGAPSAISQPTFLVKNDFYFGDNENVTKGKGNKKSFANKSFEADLNVSENEIYLMFELSHYPGMEKPTFSEGIELVKSTNGDTHDTYVIKYNSATMQAGDVKNLEIHLKFKSPTNKVVDLFQYAKYTIKLTRS